MSGPVKAGWAISTLVAATLALLPLLSGSCAAADTWPNRPVHFIVTLGPGSGVDIGARLFADKLSARWGQPVVVENRPGGDGMVAITSFLSAHDDHTLLVSPVSSFTAHPYFHDKLPYDPRDLIPIARISKTVVAVSVPTSLNVSSLKELEALARAKPGQLNWTTATGFTDFVFAGYLHTVGLKMAKVPYKNPAGAVTDLTAGVIQVYMPAYAIVRPQVEAGTVKVLAVTNHERAPAIPSVPTAVEAGYPSLEFDGLVGLFGPPGIADEVRNKIADDIRAAASDPELVKRLTATGQIVSPGNATEFAASIAQQREQVAAVAKLFGNKPVQ
ncbi:MAG TPA: tripartite tricarboxylate transporter substrate binding protein [Pseudolabrys sp.]|jgi:tripartite-type tricarboxylate transporter receptor subunit TctC|nr:tripartite tricarboxylate transporter substrate binding protein [Pseudolabrys sp.]